MMKEKATPVLFLDLDGTVRHGKDELGRFVNTPDDVVIFPEALTLMRRYRSVGYRIVGVSNQGGVALGHIPYNVCVDAMARTHELCNRLFDRIAWCVHHPDARDPEMARCWCRKPRIGLIVETCIGLAREHREYYPPHMALFVGDRPEDEECAKAANIDFMWAKDWRAMAHKPQTFTVGLRERG